MFFDQVKTRKKPGKDQEKITYIINNIIHNNAHNKIIHTQDNAHNRIMHTQDCAHSTKCVQKIVKNSKNHDFYGLNKISL